MKATRQFMSLCLVIGMTIGGNSTVLAQGADYARTTSYTSHSDKSTAKKEIRELTIGDKVPDIEFQNILNYKNKKAKLSDFKGKLVILDMWSTWCTSCIAAFPKMEKLQEQFKDKLQVLLVNPHDSKNDSEEKIKMTLSKVKSRTGFYPALPIPIHDSILNVYFPHVSVPHQIWINKNGEVVAITGGTEITKENIEAVLNGQNVNIPVKNDNGFDRSKPLLIDANEGSSNDIIYRSLFTKYKGELGFGGGVRRNDKKEIIGMYLLNQSLRSLISAAYSDIINGFSSSRIIYEVANPEQYKSEFNKEFAYCYDLIIAATPKKIFDSRKYLKQDLKKSFNIEVIKERRLLKCFVIKVTNKVEETLTRYKTSEKDIDERSIKKYFHGYSIDQIIKLLDRFDRPLIDETFSNKQIDIDFPNSIDLTSTESVFQVLRNKGFVIEETEREMEVIVIRDK